MYALVSLQVTAAILTIIYACCTKRDALHYVCFNVPESNLITEDFFYIHHSIKDALHCVCICVSRDCSVTLNTFSQTSQE